MLGRLAPIALMPAGAFAVHQLRFLLAFHGRAGIVLAQQGHAYLHSLAPWIVLGIALVLGAFVRALGHALGGRSSLPRYTVSFAALWLICAASLVAIYATQELLEGFLVTGHPAGLAGVFGYGGWWSIPAALGVGLVLAAAFHGAHWVIREVARRRGGAIATAAPKFELVRPPRGVVVPRLAPIAGGWSDRGPPR